MKIMTAMYTLRRGGAYDRFLMMLEAFLEKNFEIHCLSLTPIQIKHSLFHNHVMYYPFKTAGGLIAQLLVLFAFPPWCVWIGWKRRIDLFVAFGSFYAFMESFSKCLLKRPMVTFVRGNSSFGLQMRNSCRYAVYLNRVIERIGLHFSDRVITNNTAVQGEILKELENRNIQVQVLFNDIPPIRIHKPEDICRTREKYGVPRDAKVLVTAGVLNRGKNIEILIRCLPKIGIGGLYSMVVGDGSAQADAEYKDSLIRLARELNVEKQVLFIGWVEKEELWKICLASDLFVLPSLNEGMPNALLEALGLNLPCLGSRTPGVLDILQHDELLFDPCDHEEIAEKVKQFFSNTNVRTRILELCLDRKKAFEFDWSKRVVQMVTEGIPCKGEICQSG